MIDTWTRSRGIALLFEALAQPELDKGLERDYIQELFQQRSASAARTSARSPRRAHSIARSSTALYSA